VDLISSIRAALPANISSSNYPELLVRITN
jgi:hypothetical protein